MSVAAQHHRRDCHRHDRGQQRYPAAALVRYWAADKPTESHADQESGQRQLHLRSDRRQVGRDRRDVHVGRQRRDRSQEHDRRNHGRADRRPVSGRRVRVVGDVLTVGAVTQMVDGRTGFSHSAHRATARTAFLLTGNGSGDRRSPVPTLPVFRTPAARREDLSGHPRSLRLPLPWMREHQQGSPGFSGVPSRQRDPRDRRHPPLQR